MKIYGLFYTVGTVAMLMAANSAAAAPEAAVPVENFSGFNDISSYAATQLKPELQQAMKKEGLALFAFAVSFPGKKSCYAMVGLTQAQPEDRSPRVPHVKFSSFSIDEDNSNWKETECKAERLRSALSNLNSTSLNEAIEDIEKTRGQGGFRKKDMVDENTAYLASMSLSTKEKVFETIHQHNFAKIFDYRNVAMAAYVDGIQFKEGSILCLAVAGLAARPPENKNFRWPGSWKSSVRSQTGGTLDGCKEIVADQAVGAVLDQPWNAAGLLKNFSFTREDGIPQPDAAKVAQAVNKKLKGRLPSHRPAEPHANQRNAVSCTNQCINGSCIRTFANGRKERWQAPNIFDSLSNSWQWDVNTNACGL